MQFEKLNHQLAQVDMSAAERIKTYFQFVCDRYSVGLNLHDIAGLSEMDSSLSIVFSPYLYHNNPFCNYVKRFEATFQACARNKKVLCRMCTRSATPLYGSCYMGIEELRFPIHWKGRLLAFLCVGQFSTDLEAASQRLKTQAAKYGLNPNELEQRFLTATRPLDLNIGELHTHIGMLTQYLILLYENFLLNTHHGQSMDQRAEAHQRSFIVSRTLHYIKENFTYPITLSALAGISFCSETYLSHQFKETTGSTITEYIKELRIQKAKNLLDITTYSITLIAHQCGFNDSNYFSRVFRQHTGMSPKQYRGRD
ncbi:helix-turn-helix domain-containing protein [Paenibacillus qinlingensis]|uniref:AraC-like DNA-binding protein n=1 Tax=Paenibacillus qinlingensis TaxID=1837343 RepID=A0ABU1NY70_9BACL|nr:helix-turn-helix domain-containing protein [Paenibacillus qinlingensis]MDR6551767.1 AraC-like DNA-binding protein [Paenibacillus qinlingensis]